MLFYLFFCVYNYYILFLPEAWFWEEYAHNVCLARWFGNQYYRAVPHTAFLPLWTCSQGMVLYFKPYFATLDFSAINFVDLILICPFVRLYLIG